MQNEEQKTGLIDHLKELEDNATLRLRCIALEEEIQRLNLVLQSAQQANDISSKEVDGDNRTANIPCNHCIDMLSRMTELQGAVDVLKAAAKETAASSDPPAQQVPSILIDSIRENIRDVYIRLQKLMETSVEEAQESYSLKQISTKILNLLAQENDYNKLIESYKATVAKNIELVTRVTELEGKHRLEALTEGNNGMLHKAISNECHLNELENKIATLTHQIECLTLSNNTLKNELSAKTKSASILQSKLENYIVMQQSYLAVRDKIEELCQHALCDDREDNTKEKDNVSLHSIHNTLTVITDQLFKISALFSPDNLAETQPALHQQPHSWGVANIIARCTQLKDMNQNLQRELETVKYEHLHRLREQQEISEAREKYIEELLAQLSEEKALNVCGTDIHQSYSPEDIDEIGSLRELEDLIEKLDSTERRNISLSVTSLKQILTEAQSKSQIIEALMTIISPLRDNLIIELLENLSDTLPPDKSGCIESLISTTVVPEETTATIDLSENEYNSLRDAISKLLHVLLHCSDTLTDKETEERHDNKLVAEEISPEFKENSSDKDINEESHDKKDITVTENKQSPNSTDGKAEGLPLEETHTLAISETESTTLLDKNNNCTLNTDGDASSSQRCSPELKVNNEKNTPNKPSKPNKSSKKQVQQKRKISVCLSVQNTDQDSRKATDSSSDDEFTRERPPSDRWKALDAEDAW